MKKITIKNISFNVGENNLDFWNHVENRKWETDTFAIFDRFLDKDTVYFDVGAWIGPTVLYAAQLSELSFAFEPDPVAFNILKTNLGLNEDTKWNKTVMLFNKAVAAEKGYINIGSKASGGDSLSSVLFAGNETSWKVETVTIEDIIKTYNPGNKRLFFKIDIEGGEYPLIPVLNQTFSAHKSVLYLSFHPGNLYSSVIRNDMNVLQKIKARKKVMAIHSEILNSLPFRYRYLQSGKKINKLNLLYYTIRLRSFSIVASDEKWY